MGAGSYPKMLYRAGSSARVCNLYDVDLLTVADGNEHAAATEAGWHEHPEQAVEASPPRRRGRPRKVQE